MVKRAYRGGKREKPKSEKKKDQSLMEGLSNWAFQNITGPIAVGLVTTAVTAGSAYVLFEYPNELQKLDRVGLQFKEETAEVDVARAVVAINNNGWFTPSKGNLSRMQSTVSALAAKKSDLTLDRTFAASTLDWYSHSLSELTSEMGGIKGFELKDALAKKDQAIHSSEYEATIALLDTIGAMVIKWPSQMPEVRDTAFEAIQQRAAEIKTLAASEASLGEQILSQIDQRQAANKMKFEETTKEYERLRLKRNLALFGMLLTVLITLGSTAMTFYRQ